MGDQACSGWRQQMICSVCGKVVAWMLVVAGLLFSSVACAGTLQGTATYRERIALPVDAVFTVELLQEASRADAPAAVLGRSKLEPAGQPPFRFTIAYDDTAVQPERTCTVRAAVTHQGQVLFAAEAIYRPLNSHNEPLDMLLVSVQDKPHAESKVEGIGLLPASYEGEFTVAGKRTTMHLDLLPDGRYQLRSIDSGRPVPGATDNIGRWTFDRNNHLVLRGSNDLPLFFSVVEDGSTVQRLEAPGKVVDPLTDDRLTRLLFYRPIDPRLELTGMFIYMADAAVITLCADGRSLPVAMEGDYRSLEVAYLKTGPQAGEPLLVSLEGLITLRPSMEESLPPQPTLVVQRFISIRPQESCGSTAVDSALRGIHWKLVRLGDSPVAVAEHQAAPYLFFAVDALHVSGSGGCNGLAGNFELQGDRLRFDQMAITMKACADGMEQERSFVETLAKVQRYRIRGSHLELLDAEGTVRAQLEASE
ncbi:MAG: META domain-containing protein [Desulfobulbus oligotrophicus]|nr:META domain-containing protein [Desulfobulbus oligotrophicus]